MKKYVLVGCGMRGVLSYAVPIVKEFSDVADLVGVYDPNKGRMKLVSELCEKEIPAFDDFDTMLDETKPDAVIVTPRDCDHAEYVIRAMKKGYDVIVEKALTTTFENAVAIRETQKETGKNLTVTFNLRYHPLYKRLKELIASGVVGKVLSVHFEWLLNTNHGADYFRRWHSRRECSGSLLVHKSTHHFDIVNWLLEEKPLRVNAFGTLRFYGPNREMRGERCLTCPHKKKCRFYVDIEADDELREFYYKNEGEDGYIRDRCVFSDEINIEDSVAVNVQYDGGAIMNYSLTAHSPYEGCRLVINGTDGRLEATERKDQIVDYKEVSAQEVPIFNRRGEKIRMEIPLGNDGEGHGGADEMIRESLFREKSKDPIGQNANAEAGLMSIAIGMAANISMAEKRQVSIGEFFTELKDN